MTKFIVLTLLTLVQLTSTAARDEEAVCQQLSGPCRSSFYSGDDQSLDLEVTCVCNREIDVSNDLSKLVPIKCWKREPNTLLNHTSLRIEKCNVIDVFFPLEILKVLRSSHKFSIEVKNVNYLRLQQDAENIAKPHIEAHFENSNINGIGHGWFSGAKEVSLKIEKCSIDVIQREFISNFDKDAKVDIKIITTDVKTIKYFAFNLPKDGSLEVEGGKMHVLESQAIKGGKSVSFKAVQMSHLQADFINIHGLQSFVMEGCLVAKMQKKAIALRGQKADAWSSEFDVEEVEIVGNKFQSASPLSFASFCMIENFTFKDNWFHVMNSMLVLQATHCSLSRRWKGSVSNNGFVCNKCQDMLRTRINHQVCAMYESGWCLCDDELRANTSLVLAEGNEDNAPCRVRVRKYFEGCQTASAAKYLSECEEEKVDSRDRKAGGPEGNYGTGKDKQKGSVAPVIGLNSALASLLFLVNCFV